MTRWSVTAVMLAMLLGACAIVSKGQIDKVQAQLRCAMPSAEVEALVGKRLHKLEARDPRLTHLYRNGMTDLWLVFDDDRLRSSQVVVVQGLLGTKEEPVVNHCR
jgi:hypothetical protein